MKIYSYLASRRSVLATDMARTARRSTPPRAAGAARRGLRRVRGCALLAGDAGAARSTSATPAAGPPGRPSRAASARSCAPPTRFWAAPRAGRLPTVKRDLARLSRESFDVLVIGGGIHGAAAGARGARARPLHRAGRAGRLRAGRVANGLKIIHGGLRYLQHGDLAKVRDSVRARRETLHKVGHLRRPPCPASPARRLGLRSPARDRRCPADQRPVERPTTTSASRRRASSRAGRTSSLRRIPGRARRPSPARRPARRALGTTRSPSTLATSSGWTSSAAAAGLPSPTASTLQRFLPPRRTGRRRAGPRRTGGRGAGDPHAGRRRRRRTLAREFERPWRQRGTTSA